MTKKTEEYSTKSIAPFYATHSKIINSVILLIFHKIRKLLAKRSVTIKIMCCFENSLKLLKFLVIAILIIKQLRL